MSIRRTIVFAMALWSLACEAWTLRPPFPTLPPVDTLTAQVPVDTLTAKELSQRAKELSREGHYTQAVEWGERALEATAREQGPRDMAYADALTALAGYYSRSGQYAKAIELATQSMTLSEALTGTGTAGYAQLLNNLARYHSYVGNYIESISYGRKAVSLRSQLFGKESAEYATSLSNLAGYHSRLGNFEKALELGTEALSIRERVVGKESADYAQSLNNLSKYHYYLGDYESALLYGTKALELRRRLLGERHPDYATALSNMADYYMRAGNLPQALRCGTTAMEIRREVLGKEHPDYAESVSNLASYHYALGHSAEAVAYGREAMELRRRLLGEHHLSYAHSMCKLAIYYSANEQTDSADAYALDATALYTSTVMKTFADLTAAERDLFWRRVKPWFTNTLPRLASKHPTPKMVSSALNGTLLAKGLLLNSDMEMANLLLEGSDSTMIDAYRKLQANKALLIGEYERPLRQRTLDTDSLQRVITHQERRLVKRSKTYGNYTKSLVLKWQDISRKLKPHEAAIEFICYQDAEGVEQYGAFVLTKKTTHPQLVALTTAKEISGINSNKLYTTTKLSHLVWEPLGSYLEDVTDIYFSPAGELYNIGIESLPYWAGEGEPVSDHWKFYRLSSTREVVLGREPPSSTPSAVVYGGITYDIASGHDGRHKKKRAAKYLPGTKKEAEDIVRGFQACGIPATLYLAESATEHTFKQLSGHSPSVVHIATHGFYWTDSEVKKGQLSEKLGFLSMYDDMDVADQALTRSGLLFAGANHTLIGDETVSTHEDGVLTAKEISVLDLRDVDLLVLSACQTGLGRITGDGVFGLQRGFKKAGAHSLLMTLWKVDDVATRLLMTRFYGYLLQGVDKHDALRRAQHDLRTMEPPTPTGRRRHAISSRQKRARKAGAKKTYDDPHYWAAFILLDGLE